MARQTYARLTTPRGVFIYPRLTEADTKFVKPDGEYHTKFALVTDEEDTSNFVNQLEEILADTRKAYISDKDNKMTPAKVKRSSIADLYEEEMDDEGNDTGRLIFKFKLKAKVVTKTKSWDQRPRLFDAAAQPIESDITPWTGTEGKCNIELFPYYMESTKQFGLSLRLKGAQILKLVTGGGETAEDQGFGAEAGGYTAEVADDESGFTANDADNSEDGEEF